MTPPTLAVSAALALGTAIGFAVVGALVAGRTTRAPAQLAAYAFAAFWFSGAIVAGSQGARLFSASLGIDSMALIVALEQVSTPFYCMAAAALVVYVLYLHTGRSGLAIPVTLYYLVLFPVLRYHVARADPIGYVVTDWQVNYVYAQPLQSTGYAIALALVTLPVIASVIAYATLANRTSDVPTRYRIVCVSAGLALWVGIEAFAFATGLAATSAGEILRRSLGIAAAMAVVLAYAPPAWARRRWGARASCEAPA